MPRDNRIDREHLRTTLESAGWQVVFRTLFAPTIRAWKKELLYSVNLAEHERRGMVRALSLFQEGIVSAYEKSGAHQPEWITREFELDDDV